MDFIQTTDFNLEMDVDFDSTVIRATNTLTLKAVQDTSEIVLDYQGLVITSAAYKVAGAAAFVDAYFETQQDAQLGGALRVYLTDKAEAGAEVALQVQFFTTNQSLAINWLTKEQTASQTLKYLYTKCEPIHCRAIAPLQDTPAIKSTYSAQVTVPQPYRVNMSATCLDQVDSQQKSTFRFRQQNKIPSYLLAIVIGNLATQPIDQRTSVISEPTKLQEYAGILKDLGTLLDKTEAYVKVPYQWPSYTILVLPPSFPVGGMENPQLTFASPTIMVPDGSQIYVATHEIAHSWTGNYVTCQDWSNLWLNEGFTTFIERRVSFEQDGKDFSFVESLLGNSSFYDDMLGFGLNSSYSSLYPQVGNRAPDSASSQVTYEKGQQFMYYLMSVVDSEDDFRDFLQHYLTTYQWQSITFLEVRLAFNDFLLAKYGPEKAQLLAQKVDWAAWVQTPGPIPPNSGINFNTPTSDAFLALADQYIALGGFSSPANIDIYKQETKDVNLKVVFNNELLSRQSELNYRVLARIDADLGVSGDKNPEIGQRWYPLAIGLAYEVVFPAAKAYVQGIGRQKYILPVYTALAKNGYRNLAYQWYSERSTFYHPIAAANIRKIIFSTVEQIQAYEAQIELAADEDERLFLH